MGEIGLRVLVVDDEQAIRRDLRATLNAHGFIISEAVDSLQALFTAATDRSELVILDLGLPDMNGIEVTRRLREWTSISIIILSVREQENDKIAALDAGADDYLTKPFGTGELMARIRVTLRRSSQTIEEPIFQVDDLSST
jgi:two-component system, OmpR family, KDP operon response regulator KdpE